MNPRPKATGGAGSPLVRLSASTIDLVEGPVGIVVATAGEDLVPDLVQALGARVLGDGRVVVVVARSQAEGVLEVLDLGASVAVTFSEPSTHRTVQLKADAVQIAPARRSDREAVERYRRRFEAELERVGFDRAYSRALLAAHDDDLVALTLTPSAAFEQTPGDRAGQSLADAEAPS